MTDNTTYNSINEALRNVYEDCGDNPQDDSNSAVFAYQHILALVLNQKFNGTSDQDVVQNVIAEARTKLEELGHPVTSNPRGISR